MRRSTQLVVGAVIALAFCLTNVAGQTVRLYVDRDNGLGVPVGDPPGTQWSDAYLYLSDALFAASQLLEDQQATAIEIWLIGDTATPYLPHETAAPDFTDESGTFSDTIGEVSAFWDECGATITFTPWTGTGAGTPLTYAAAVPDGECSTILAGAPVTSVGT